MTQDEQKQFIEKFNKLLEEYKISLSVVVTPRNLFSKIFRKLIQVNWKIIFTNNTDTK